MLPYFIRTWKRKIEHMNMYQVLLLKENQRRMGSNLFYMNMYHWKNVCAVITDMSVTHFALGKYTRNYSYIHSFHTYMETVQTTLFTRLKDKDFTGAFTCTGTIFMVSVHCDVTVLFHYKSWDHHHIHRQWSAQLNGFLHTCRVYCPVS